MTTGKTTQGRPLDAGRFRHPEARILVFAKAPRPGEVKTRLIPALGAEGAAALHGLLTTQTVATVARARLAPAVLCCAPTAEDRFLACLAEEAGMALYTQRGADLGERMMHAIADAQRAARYVLVVGTDCPALDEDYLEEALDRLAAGVDVVLGPAVDGGYVLLGLSRPVDWRLFRGVPWGSAQVLTATRARIQRLRWRLHELPFRRDLDRPEDLARMWA